MILDAVPDVVEISKEIDGRLRLGCREEHLKSLSESVEGWWLRQAVRRRFQGDKAEQLILARELSSTIADARDRLMPENLPVDFATELKTPAAADVPENQRRFIKQLELISLSDIQFSRRSATTYALLQAGIAFCITGCFQNVSPAWIRHRTGAHDNCTPKYPADR